MKIKYITKGLIKSIPGIERFYNFHKSTGGTNNSRYCYSVWLRHLSYAYENKSTEVPQRVIELGPGDSLGIGLAALISGAEQYYGLDIVRYSNTLINLQIFDELVTLFKEKAPIPGPDEFPKVMPLLNDYRFPEHIFSDKNLAYLLSEERLTKIREAIKLLDTPGMTGNMIELIVPWYHQRVIADNSIDYIFSQSVLQHIDELELAFKRMHQWLKPGCLMSHEIDFGSMRSSDEWFGHWEYSDLEWKIVKGRKLFYINREPHSTYLALLKKYNFELIFEKKTLVTPTQFKNRLAKRYKGLSNEDISTKNAFILARKLP